jgi:hypothetical protein
VSNAYTSMGQLTEWDSEKYMKRLIGRTDLEDALKRLDKLTLEEARMAIAQNLKATHNGERVRGVANPGAAQAVSIRKGQVVKIDTSL